MLRTLTLLLILKLTRTQACTPQLHIPILQDTIILHLDGTNTYTYNYPTFVFTTLPKVLVSLESYEYVENKEKGIEYEFQWEHSQTGINFKRHSATVKWRVMKWRIWIMDRQLGVQIKFMEYDRIQGENIVTMPSNSTSSFISVVSINCTTTRALNYSIQYQNSLSISTIVITTNAETTIRHLIFLFATVQPTHLPYHLHTYHISPSAASLTPVQSYPLSYVMLSIVALQLTNTKKVSLGLEMEEGVLSVSEYPMSVGLIWMEVQSEVVCDGCEGTLLIKNQNTYTCVRECPSPLIQSSSHCRPCPSLLHQTYSNNTCICEEGYQMSSSHQCTSLLHHSLSECPQPHMHSVNGKCQCEDLYYKDEFNRCVGFCSSNMYWSTQQNKCICLTGYTLSDGICILSNICGTNQIYYNQSCICNSNTIRKGDICEMCPQKTYKGVDECVKCKEECRTCFSRVFCLSCQLDFRFQEGDCVQICGNGLRTVEDGCDDGNIQPGDGCNEDCQVEEGWNCWKEGEGDVCVQQNPLKVTLDSRSPLYTSPGIIIDMIVTPAQQLSQEEVECTFTVEVSDPAAQPSRIYLSQNQEDTSRFRCLLFYRGLLPIVDFVITVIIHPPYTTETQLLRLVSTPINSIQSAIKIQSSGRQYLF